ncbi:Pyruvate, phosphate dikinase [Aduncisulcus paluster]|uniref:pyruvate, phosphate dikinase n=1 Tax=Aduncisulcus paluster TaxID=2918883 RepID=A0ABQ5KUS6_9EUKA|nr:Pyruvate, phosphate dikinase [Aduncisulcus paluster]
MTGITYFGKYEGATPKEDLGGKGVSLNMMTKAGLPVPPGFTIWTSECVYFMEHGVWSPELETRVNELIKSVEKDTGKEFGSNSNPLLLSVRSGARVSMPGMMDTVLNLGLNDEAVEGMAKKTKNPRFAYDSFRRFLQMFGDVVMGVEHAKFEKVLDAVKEVIKGYRALIQEETGKEFPQNPKLQLTMAINAVFASWNNPRAIVYRNLNHMGHNWGTAVNVQSMVYGNTGDNSGTGVGFTRDPSTGERVAFGEFLTNAQGEDVVAGIRTPFPLASMAGLSGPWPRVYEELMGIYKRLEEFYKDMVDLEFTIEDGKLYMLQARVGKRTGAAMVRIACELVDEGVIDKKTAMMRIDPPKINELLFENFDPKVSYADKVLAKGLPASPGAAVGQIVFEAEAAVEAKAEKRATILCRPETSPEDIAGMDAAIGVLTARGGLSSHAAVVARGMGKCCVAGCGECRIDEEAGIMTIGGKTFKEGDFISLNGSTGEVIEGKVPTIKPEISGHFGRIMNWSNEFKTLQIRTNADTPEDTKVAVEFGAEGIGLCRTEHMFFQADKISAIREMILAADAKARKVALDKVLPLQQIDFEGIFEALEGRPCTVRLLDPPLHEFLPHDDENQTAMAKQIGCEVEEIKAKVHELSESNPMLGFRGCRLGMIYPEISEMQVTALTQAAIAVEKKGIKVRPEIMIPVVCLPAEVKVLRKVICDRVDAVMEKAGVKIPYQVGTMIELPAACLQADKIAEHAEFFSFGTNDLTQTTLGISRDDAGRFVPTYVRNGHFDRDPFSEIHEETVGELIKIAVTKGRSVRKGMKISLCGEQSSQKSVLFLHKAGLSVVSASPYRIPALRVAAAQAAIICEE